MEKNLSTKHNSQELINKLRSQSATIQSQFNSIPSPQIPINNIKKGLSEILLLLGHGLSNEFTKKFAQIKSSSLPQDSPSLNLAEIFGKTKAIINPIYNQLTDISEFCILANKSHSELFNLCQICCDQIIINGKIQYPKTTQIIEHSQNFGRLVYPKKASKSPSISPNWLLKPKSLPLDNALNPHIRSNSQEPQKNVFHKNSNGPRSPPPAPLENEIKELKDKIKRLSIDLSNLIEERAQLKLQMVSQSSSTQLQEEMQKIVVENSKLHQILQKLEMKASTRKTSLQKVYNMLVEKDRELKKYRSSLPPHSSSDYVVDGGPPRTPTLQVTSTTGIGLSGANITEQNNRYQGSHTLRNIVDQLSKLKSDLGACQIVNDTGLSLLQNMAQKIITIFSAYQKKYLKTTTMHIRLIQLIDPSFVFKENADESPIELLEHLIIKQRENFVLEKKFSRVLSTPEQICQNKNSAENSDSSPIDCKHEENAQLKNTQKIKAIKYNYYNKSQ